MSRTAQQSEPVLRFSEYDAFAWFYNQYWGGAFRDRALAAIDRLVSPALPSGAKVLDLCCGAGHLAQALAARGQQVTGIDGSAALLDLARARAPQAEFILADARSFSLSPVHQLAVSAYDSLNHLMLIGDLAAAFKNVSAALATDGHFLFDLNMELGFEQRWNGDWSIVAEDHVFIGRASYAARDRVARLEITMFRHLDESWQRSDLSLRQACYDQDEVCQALRAAGFAKIEAYDAVETFGWQQEVGRTFFVARKIR